MHSIDTARLRYLDMIHRYLQGRLDYLSFRTRLRSQWTQERDALWHDVWLATHAQRCLERKQLEQGQAPCAEPADPRRLPRMLDRLFTLSIQTLSIQGQPEPEPFRASIEALLAAYRCPGSASPEARFLDYPPRIAVFERPLPPGSKHRYLCSVEEVRLQLALVPEYDLEGLWAIGLAPRDREYHRAYGVYFRSYYPVRKPVILLHSVRTGLGFILRARSAPGILKQTCRVECSYGIEIDRIGGRVICRRTAESYRRFMVEHVLLHEIGHHVQYQQRWRAGLYRWLPSHIEEQFAEDYAIRFHREQKEGS